MIFRKQKKKQRDYYQRPGFLANPQTGHVHSESAWHAIRHPGHESQEDIENSIQEESGKCEVDLASLTTDGLKKMSPQKIQQIKSSLETLRSRISYYINIENLPEEKFAKNHLNKFEELLNYLNSHG